MTKLNARQRLLLLAIQERAEVILLADEFDTKFMEIAEPSYLKIWKAIAESVAKNADPITYETNS